MVIFFTAHILCHFYNQSNSSLLDSDPVFAKFERWLQESCAHFMTEVHNYVLPEGADDLFLINRITGKKYKFNLTEV